MGFSVAGQGFTAQLLSHIQTYCSSFMSQHLPATWKHHLFYVYIYIPQCLPRSKQFSTAGNPANGLPLQPSNSDHRGGGRGMSLLLKMLGGGLAGSLLPLTASPGAAPLAADAASHQDHCIALWYQMAHRGFAGCIFGVKRGTILSMCVFLFHV